MQLSHTRPVASAVFDEPNLVSSAGLVPLMALARKARLRELADERLTVPTDKGANPGLKISSLVAGMVAGADSFEDMALLRHGGMGTVLPAGYAPSTLGSFLRSFTFGHVRQLDAVAFRFLLNLAEHTGLLGGGQDSGPVLVDLDDTIVEVHGYAKQGAAFGYSGVRGLNAVLATVSTETVAPVIVAQRLRKGSAGSPRGGVRLATDALALIRRTRLAGGRAGPGGLGVLLPRPGHRGAQGGGDVSITVRMDAAVKRAIAGLAEDGWTTIRYPDAIFDEATGSWISKAQVAEVPFTAFVSHKKADQIPGRLIVRRIPEPNPKKSDGQQTLFDSWRFHAFFTTTDPATADTVAADRTHRRHAIIENVHADLKGSALAHLPSGVFNANAAWLVCAVMAFNLTRAAATLTRAAALAKATTATIRRKLIAVPARIATSARRLHLHLPSRWPWQAAWSALYDALFTTLQAPRTPDAHPTGRYARPRQVFTWASPAVHRGNPGRSPGRPTVAPQRRDRTGDQLPRGSTSRRLRLLGRHQQRRRRVA